MVQPIQRKILTSPQTQQFAGATHSSANIQMHKGIIAALNRDKDRLRLLIPIESYGKSERWANLVEEMIEETVDRIDEFPDGQSVIAHLAEGYRECKTKSLYEESTELYKHIAENSDNLSQEVNTGCVTKPRIRESFKQP